jgi:hypothetical protein
MIPAMRRFFIVLAMVPLPFAHVIAESTPVEYLRDIKPLLRDRCYACHGALKQKAGLRLDTGAAILRGSDEGAVINAAHPVESELLRRIASTDLDERMPPEGDPLKPAEIARLRAWIERGTPAPADEKPEPDPRDHWAFKIPTRAPIPVFRQSNATSVNPIDAFLRVEQEKHGLVVAAPANKATLLRRVYLDLTGLPPGRDALRDFIADESPDAFEKVVDQLLASPEYAQRWARHWLDIWRYADWYGRRHVPDVWNSAPQIWRWRDWVVDSLEADKGFDRMITEMLAADEVAPGDDHARVATGYLVRNWYALNPNQWMRDIVEHTGKAFLALTFNCAHCHDHKYDPISQRDYFRFRAFFEPLQLRQDRVPGEADPGPFEKYEYSKQRKVVLPGMISVFDERLDAQTAIYLRGDERNLPENKPVVSAAMPAFLRGEALAIERIDLPPEAHYPGMKPFIQREETAKRAQALVDAGNKLAAAQREREDLRNSFFASDEPPGDLAISAANALQLLRTEASVRELHVQREIAQAECDAIAARIAADKARFTRSLESADAAAQDAVRAEANVAVQNAELKLVQAKNARALLQTEEGLAETRAATTGTARTAEEKSRGASALKSADDQIAAARKVLATARTAVETKKTNYTPLTPSFPAQSSGRRRALAAWMTSRENPLTARVAINHIWMRHFHTPLVASVFDFGRNGATPTHPELLDWLAVEFIEHGWSMKHMHRLIVTSAAYQRVSVVPASETERGAFARNEAIDPENRFLWRMNPGQMEAEVVRDSVLRLAGTLEAMRGGAPIPNTDAEKSKRRSLYFECYPEPGGQSDFASAFDPPEPMECYRRTKTVVPQQALTLSNSTLVAQQSIIIAKELSCRAARADEVAGADARAFIVAAYEHLLARTPGDNEREACERFLGKQQQASSAEDARASLVRVLLNHNDFISIR